MGTVELVMILVGVIAVIMGVYELSMKKVVGRNVTASKPEEIVKFSRIDGVTYLIEGTLCILLGFSDYIPFMNGSIMPLVVLIAIIALVIFNYVMAKKILSREVK